METNKEFKNLISSYNKNIQSIARKFLSASQDVDDIEQEVYIKVWKNRDKYRGESSLWGWMRIITVNTCKDYLKRLKKHRDNTINDEEKITNVHDKKVDIENKASSRERQKYILSKINKLKPKLKDVIIMHDIDGLTYEEIAVKVKCPVGTVKSRLFNARKALMTELEDLL